MVYPSTIASYHDNSLRAAPDCCPERQSQVRGILIGWVSFNLLPSGVEPFGGDGIEVPDQ
jgi:hypothetical protein